MWVRPQDGHFFFLLVLVLVLENAVGIEDEDDDEDDNRIPPTCNHTQIPRHPKSCVTEPWNATSVSET